MSGELSIITEFKPFELAASDSSAMLQRFVSSEGVYVTEVLGKLVELQRISTEQKLLNPQEIEGIFRNVKDLYEIHYQFYREMGRDIAQAIKTYTPFFKMYGIYMTSHEQAMKLLKEKALKSKKITEVLNSVRGNFTVDFLFELPIVRLKQYADYAMILSENLPEKNKNSTDFETALEKLNVILEEIIENEFKRLARQDVYILQAEVFNDKIDIMSPSRFLIKKGLISFSEDGKEFKDGALILFNDFFLVSTAKFKPKVISRIEDLKCTIENSVKKYSYIFSVKCEAGIIYFCAPSEDERYVWISTICEASEKESDKPASNLTHAAFSRIILKKAKPEDIRLQDQTVRISSPPTSPRISTPTATKKDDPNEEDPFSVDSEQYRKARVSFALPIGAKLSDSFSSKKQALSKCKSLRAANAAQRSEKFDAE
jgi:hypothetical protein